MKIEWQFSAEDVSSVRAFIAQHDKNECVRERYAHNLAESKKPICRNSFWRELVAARLTSVQKSGPNSPVSRFCKRDPFPLAYEAVRRRTTTKDDLAQVLYHAGGIRFHNRIAGDLIENLRILEAGEWEGVLEQCNRLLRANSYEAERAVANYLMDKFSGFGPKQSRNLLQSLGLTRYEVPIDSRVTAWLNAFGFPIKLSPIALADSAYYEFICDAIRALCAESRIFPCILDAAIFSARNNDGGEA